MKRERLGDVVERERLSRLPVPELKYDPFFAHEARIICEELGASTTVLARVFGVSLTTIRRWFVEYPDFGEAYYKGREIFDNSRVKGALLKRCLGFRYKETKVERVVPKNRLKGALKGKYRGGPIKITTIYKYLPPSVEGQRLWLQSRDPENFPGSSLNIKSTSTETKEYVFRLELDKLKLLPIHEREALLLTMRKLKEAGGNGKGNKSRVVKMKSCDNAKSYEADYEEEAHYQEEAGRQEEADYGEAED